MTKQNTIQSTTNYGMFQLMKGNRAVDYNHVKRLKRSMEKDPHLFASNPIQVNENNYIIDGQHRRQAAQELGVPVYYTVSIGISLDDTRVLNITQKRWTLLDFAQSFADSGREDYRQFLTAYRQFPNLAPSIIVMCLQGGHRANGSVDFRRGEFAIDNYERAVEWMARLTAVAEKTHIQMNTPMTASFLQLFKSNPDFDFDKFLAKLDKDGARALYSTSSSVRSSLRAIEDVYNHQSNTRVRLY